MTVYYQGQRIVLVHTTDAYSDLRPGATGTVRSHDQTADRGRRLDNGSSLSMCLDAGYRIEPVTTPLRTPVAPARRPAAGKTAWRGCARQPRKPVEPLPSGGRRTPSAAGPAV